MTDGSEPIFTIVVGTDFSELADHAVDQALEFASLHAPAEVHVVYVEPDVNPPAPRFARDDEALTNVYAHLTERLAAVAPSLAGRGLRRVVGHFRRGDAAEKIAQLAADLDADLVMVGSHGHRGLARIFLGSVAERTARLARCPVWILRPKDHNTAGRVPDIDPPCAECAATRRKSHGEALWCALHVDRNRLSRSHETSRGREGASGE